MGSLFRDLHRSRRSGADPGYCQGQPELQRLKVADGANQSHTNEVSYLQMGSRACLRALQAFECLILKIYAFSHILETLSLILDN